MISTQDAFARAQQYAAELLGAKEYTLEEIERDVYKSRPVWRITLGFPKRRVSAQSSSGLWVQVYPSNTKRFS